MPNTWSNLDDALRDIHENGFPDEPVALSEELINDLGEHERDILYRLDDVTTKAVELSKKIEARRPNASGVFNDGYAVTVCEDQDDFLVITAGLRRELSEVTRQVQSILGEAIMNGLAHLGIIQRESVQYKLVTVPDQ